MLITNLRQLRPGVRFRMEVRFGLRYGYTGPAVLTVTGPCRAGRVPTRIEYPEWLPVTPVYDFEKLLERKATLCLCGKETKP